ncbi:cell division protein FtsL [Comamonas odontotermitis]|uniref:cell division protein FtsL n=1 Tax=Comamonas odontotermitis TaxID=379895 RepID=UPI00160CD15A|nr:cell division protein FtsL [Comamonas odontotermitis]
MLRLNILLLILSILSAMALVQSQYEARKLFTELDRTVAQSRQLETDHQRLQVEKRAQATPLRLEQLARDKIGMQTATPAVTVYVQEPGAGAAP